MGRLVRQDGSTDGRLVKERYGGEKWDLATRLMVVAAIILLLASWVVCAIVL